MIKNYLKTTIRYFIRNRQSSFINLLGLTVAMTVAGIIYLYTAHELNADQFHQDSHRMYRVITHVSDAQEDNLYGQTAPPLAHESLKQIEELEAVHRLFQFTGQMNFSQDGDRFTERSWYMVDDNFFTFFDFELIEGDSKTVLSKPNSIVLSETMAKKYFGKTDVVGLGMKESHLGELVVTGVFKDVPENSHLDFELLLSQSLTSDRWKRSAMDWAGFGAFTYLKSKEGVPTKQLVNQLNAVYKENVEENTAASRSIEVQPLLEIYFHSKDILYGVRGNSNELIYVQFLSVAALFIMLIAAVNYTNLSTARASKRAKEIGMRKVTGASRGQLVSQFLLESVIISYISAGFSIILIDLLLPGFSNLADRTLVLEGMVFKEVIMVLLFTGTVIGLLAGMYPAIYLSGLRPAKSLKGGGSDKGGAMFIRKGLVVFQYTLSGIMILLTLGAFKQLNYLTNKPLGFDKENILIVDINDGGTRRAFRSMIHEFENIEGVTKVSTTSRVPGEWKNYREFDIKDVQHRDDSVRTFYMSFDKNGFDVFGIKIKEGSVFAGMDQSDSLKVLVNEKTVEAMGWDQPIGQKITMRNQATEYTVVGVMEDFNFQSLYNQVEPLVIGNWNCRVHVIDYFSLKYQTEDLETLLSKVAEVHEKFDPNTEVEYHFLDQQIESFYKADKNMSLFFAISAIITIVIACLGMYGLSSFLMEQRQKSISVKKVFGASDLGLMVDTSKGFVFQVLVSALISIPIAMLLLKDWLDNFVFYKSLSVLEIILAVVGILLITLLTIGQRVVGAIRSNPATILRNE